MKYPKRYVPPKVTRVILRQEDCPFTGPCIGRYRCGAIRKTALSCGNACLDGDARTQLGRRDEDEKV